MKAALLEAFGQPLRITEVPDPALGTGEVIVDVAIAPVLSYAHEILSGARNYALQLPIVPGGGAIGRVRARGPDATSLAIGDWVMTDPTVRSRDNPLAPISSCRASPRRRPARSDCTRTFMTARGPSRSACRPRTPARSDH